MCDNCGFVFFDNTEGWYWCADCTESMTTGASVTRPQTPAAQSRKQITATVEQNQD
jgi:uncharacterized Zn finger protein (UPF0148 family)